MAYNRALDFKKYEEDFKLMLQGQYYPPDCVMTELSEFLSLLEKDKDDCISGKGQFQQEIENRDLKDVESHEDSVGGKRKMLWECCGKDRYGYHLKLFGDFCYTHLCCDFKSYLNAINVKESLPKVVQLNPSFSYLGHHF